MTVGSSRRVGITGLGYVGRPIAAAFAGSHYGTIGAVIDKSLVAELLDEYARTAGVASERVAISCQFVLADPDPATLERKRLFGRTVPTHIDFHVASQGCGPKARVNQGCRIAGTRRSQGLAGSR